MLVRREGYCRTDGVGMVVCRDDMTAVLRMMGMVVRRGCAGTSCLVLRGGYGSTSCLVLRGVRLYQGMTGL
eukprot:2279039-Rhodomonas_salina.1